MGELSRFNRSVKLDDETRDEAFSAKPYKLTLKYTHEL